MNPRVWHDGRVRAPRRLRLLALTVLLLVIAPLATGCLRARTTLTVSADDTVSGYIMAAVKPATDDDPGPQFRRDLSFGNKLAVSKYNHDGYVGSEAVFSNLSFGEVPQLADLNADAAGVDLSLRRAGDLVILEGRVDLTSLPEGDNEVRLTVNFPGEVTSTNGERVSGQSVNWQLKAGIVNTMAAQSRYTDPSTRALNRAATWLGLAALIAAGIVGYLAYRFRDTSPRLSVGSTEQD
ncbi:DUF3153 domain-containing protein [Mycolicibacterium brumae]|uniref:DUF3153 domain-containing protein n=1 Tax=Mycolicibacterium brumae TaxID=85968 RepID=A0A2G5P704_9MYCO|nr:DUF3153 domain-containing protein [Mycolicibacterium brumae]RWA19420.1 hypothetical protein MBRU_16845 [Mycolicibacterium brumae DSM 44177]